MIATWMLYASLVGLFVALAAHALDRAARATRLPTRFIWLAAIIATCLAPIVGYVVRRASLDAATGVTAGAVTAVESGTGTGVTQSSVLFRTFIVAKAIAAKVDRPAALLWLALTLILLGRLVYATGMIWRHRRQWTAKEIDGVPLFVTPDLGPAVVALPRSEILVPEWLLSLDAVQISLVLRHEREHRAAGDPRLLIAATLLRALMPWNPSVWWQMRRLRLAVEMDCDARVLRAEPRVDRYGSLLLAIAQHPRAALYGAATLTESTSDLERRIDAMTGTPSSAPRITAAALGALAIAAVFAACEMPSPDVIAGPPASVNTAPTDKPPRAMSPDRPMFDFQVESPVQGLPGNTPPQYPNVLRTAGIGGTVIAKFVVDTGGRVDARTVEIVKSDHGLFAQSVRQTLLDMRFKPAEVGGLRVKQLVQMPFVFSLATEKTASPRTMADGSPDSSSARIISDRAIAKVLVRKIPDVIIDGYRPPTDLKERKRPPT